MSIIMPIPSCLKAARITKLHQTCNPICRNDPLCTAFMKRYELCQPKTRNMDWICLLIQYMCSYKKGIVDANSALSMLHYIATEQTQSFHAAYYGCVSQRRLSQSIPINAEPTQLIGVCPRHTYKSDWPTPLFCRPSVRQALAIFNINPRMYFATAHITMLYAIRVSNLVPPD